MPPVAASVCEYAWPTSPSDNVVVVICGGGGGGGGGVPSAQLTARPFVSCGWLNDTCLPTTPSGRSTPAVADAPAFQVEFPKSVSRYWNFTSPFSFSASSTVTVPLPESEK